MSLEANAKSAVAKKTEPVGGKGRVVVEQEVLDAVIGRKNFEQDVPSLCVWAGGGG